MKEYYKLGGRIQDDRSGMMGLQRDEALLLHCYHDWNYERDNDADSGFV